MAKQKNYNLLVRRLDKSGPCTVAVDIGRQAKAKGYCVRLLYLSGGISREDISDFEEVRRWKILDIFTLPGILHTHCLRADLIGGVLALFGRRNVITTLHNLFLIDLLFDHKRWKVMLAWCAWSRLICHMDGVFCISQSMERYYKKKLPRAPLKIAYNFRFPSEMANQNVIDGLTKRFLPWVKSQRLAGRKIIVFVGGINKRKNIIKLSEIIASRESVALVICGKGPDEEKLFRLINDQSANQNVLYLGEILRPDLVIDKCDALVLPSLAEGLPLVVLEAARLGKPSLLSNIAVHRELAHLRLGITFDHRKFSDFDTALQKLSFLSMNKQVVELAFQENFSSEVGFDRYEKHFPSD
jgi:glycosyltransferase involved in cell wall biosynthesis